MNFFDRYERLCLARGYKPASQQAAEAIGTNRGTISAWKTSGSPPKTEYLVAIADVYRVSADYLLGRTEDPTDYAHLDLEIAAKKELAMKNVRDREPTPAGAVLYQRLDPVDQGKAEAFMQGLLAQDTYAALASGKRA